MDLKLHEHGHIETRIDIEGAGLLIEEVYPLCGMATQTVAYSGGDVKIVIRTDTFESRIVLK